MAGKIESGRKKILNKIKLGVLYLTIQVKILLLGALFLRGKSLKGLLPFLMGLLLLASPGILPAQTPVWPWLFGQSFQLTDDGKDNFSPAIASNGNFFFAVWYRRTSSGFDIYGARLDKEGNVFEDDQGGIPICTAPDDQMFPAVSWNGENFFVAWQDRRSGKRWDIYGARVAAFGRFLSVMDPDGIPISVGMSNNDQVGPCLAFDGERQLVVWRAKRNTKAWSIYCRFIKETNGQVALDESTVQVSASLKDQASPSVVFNPTSGHYFIVWQDKRGGKFWDIYGARVAPDGTLLDPGDVPVSTSGHSGPGWDRWMPVVSSDGENYLVVWTASHDGTIWSLFGRGMDPNGNFLEAFDLVLQRNDTSKNFPALLWDGDEYLLAWEDNPSADSTISGAPVMPGYRMTIGDGEQISGPGLTDAAFPALSESGDDILVVWQAVSPDSGYWQVYGQRLSKVKVGR
jgi:hypothetical protein